MLTALILYPVGTQVYIGPPIRCGMPVNVMSEAKKLWMNINSFLDCDRISENYIDIFEVLLMELQSVDIF